MTTEEILLLELFNHKDDVQKLWLEPWCEEFELRKGISWRLTGVGVSQASSTVTVEFYDDQVVIHGVPNAIMRAYADGKLVWECFRPFLLPEQIDPNYGKN